MSTIAITITPVDNSSTNGVFTVVFNDGSQDIPLPLIGALSAPITGYFGLIPYASDIIGSNTCYSLGVAFSRDFRNVGGANNLTWAVNGNVLTITAQTGIFISSSYTGSYFNQSSSINNTAQTPPIVLSSSNLGTGDCDSVLFSATVSGGAAPYALSTGGVDILSSWNGAETQFNLSRLLLVATLKVVDNNGLEKELQVTIPRKLKPGEFKERATQFIGYSDILIENVNPVADTEPIEYALEPQGTTSGQSYKVTNTFPGVIPGTYELFVKDRYGCEITKTIIVSSFQDATEEQNPRYFEVMQGNSIVFSECPEYNINTKKNFENTLSFNELAKLTYGIKQSFHPTDIEPTQFKSSYPYHVITLTKCDGTKLDIKPIMIQENLGHEEKVDCKLFPFDGKTGVYFDGGNEYEPNTSTVIGASPYTQFLPNWGQVGQVVTVEGLGTFDVLEAGYDQTISKGYFVINAVTATIADGKIQVKYNVQEYNTFQFYTIFSQFTKGIITIEKGLNFNSVEGNKWGSELIESKEDSNSLLIEWSDSKNKAGIVFYSGVPNEPIIKYKKRVKGKFRATWDGLSEVSDGDSRVYSLKQSSYQRYRLELEKISAKEVQQLVIASGMSGFMINNVPLIRLKYPDIEPLDESNLYEFKCDFGYSGNSLAEQSNEIVLNPSTGVVGGGGTGKEGVNDSKNRMSVDGLYVTIDGKYIAV